MNCFRVTQMPLRHRVGPTAMHRAASASLNLRNIFAGDAGISPKNGIPSGHLPPSSWVMPQVGGGMSAFTGTYITVDTPSAVLAGGVNISGTTNIIISAPPTLLNLIAGLFGTTTITFSSPPATLGGTSYLSGTAAITFSAPPAVLGGIANITAASYVVFSSSATIRAVGFMSAPAPDASPTPANVADAVWSNIVASGHSASEIMELLAAVAAGKTNISNLGGGASIVTFRNVADNRDAVVAGMIGSKRDTVTLDID